MLISGIVQNRHRYDVYLEGQYLDPAPSQAIINHSPDGFCWGYGGSGPAQLALAILLYIYGEKTAREYYQAFKWAHVSTWNINEDFCVEIDIDAWLAGQDDSQKSHSKIGYGNKLEVEE